jgi:hypothetical protein
MLPSPVGSFRALQRFPKLFLAAILVTGCGGGGGGGSGSDPAHLRPARLPGSVRSSSTASGLMSLAQT